MRTVIRYRPDTVVPGPKPEERFPFDRPGFVPLYRGRVAIWHAIRALGLEPGQTILLPSYHCGSEVDPYLQFGLEVRFYRIGTDLLPDLAHLAELSDGAVALHVTHFFGLPQPMGEYAAVAREHGLKLIEDCAPVAFGRVAEGWLGEFGDAAIFSFRKTMPVFDGGGLLLKEGAGLSGEGPARPPLLWLARKHLGQLQRRWRQPTAAAPGGAQEDPHLWDEMRFKAEQSAIGCSPLSLRSLRGHDPETVATARRENYLVLAGHIDGIVGLRALRPTVEPGVSPWVLPVDLDDPLGVRRRMLPLGVDPLIVWNALHPRIDLTPFADAVVLKERTLGLPVHQALRPEDLDRIAESLEQAVRSR